VQVANKIHPNEVSPSFCILPWIHLSTRPNGHLRLCCTANASSAGATNDKKYGGEVGVLKSDAGRPANLGHIDLLEAWNSDFMKRTRRMMLAGEIPASCQKCFKEESAGHRSKRIWETEYWSQRLEVQEMLRNTTEEGSVPPRIAYVDLRLGTKCNLKCVMCSPHDSSRWVQDWREIYPQIENPSLREAFQWSQDGQVDGASYNWHQHNPRFCNCTLPVVSRPSFANTMNCSKSASAEAKLTTSSCATIAMVLSSPKSCLNFGGTSSACAFISVWTALAK
jgi:hypothetical protein